MDEKKRAKRIPLTRLYLYLIGTLAVSAAVFALCYSGGGANVLVNAASNASASPEGSASPGGSAEITPDGTPSVTPSPAPSTAGRLIPFLGANGLWGYKNADGETVAEPGYDAALEFQGDVVFASKGGLYGLISRGFNWIAPPARGINNQPVDFAYVRFN